MPAELHYFPEHQLALERFTGIVTLDELKSVNDRFLKLVEQSETPVHSLIDLRTIAKYPASMSQLRDGIRVTHSPKIGWVILLINDRNRLMKLAATITQVSIRGVRFRMFHDLSEALRFIGNL